MRNVMSEQARSFSRCTLQGPLGFPVGTVTIIFCLPHQSKDGGGKVVGRCMGWGQVGGGEAWSSKQGSGSNFMPTLRKTGEDRLKKLAVCLNSLCDEWEEGALWRAFFPVHSDFVVIWCTCSPTFCDPLDHRSWVIDHQPKQNLAVFPGETGVPK